MRPITLCLSLFAVLVAFAVASAAIDPSAVYLGSPESFNSPAEIRASEVFEAIPEYRRIRQEKIKPNDARYWLLMNRANRRFRKALKVVANTCGYDLIVEAGTMGAYKGKSIPDITGDVILAL